MVPSVPGAALMRPPSESMARASSSAESLPVPRVSVPAVSAARPSLPGGSCAAPAPDLVAREGRIEQHLAEEIEPGPEVLGEELGRDDGAVRARRRADAAAQPVDRARQLVGGELPRAPGERAGGERREAFLPRRVLRRARAHDQVELDQRQLVVLRDQHAEPVVEGRARDGRQAKLVGREGRGGERQEQRQRAHETPPARGGSSFTGWPEATGSRTTTVRLAGWR